MIKSIYKGSLLAAFASGLAVTSASAQVAFTGTYTQNFSSLSSTSTSAPVGWSVYSEAGGNSTFAPLGSSTVGVAPNFTAGALTAEPTLIAGTPTTQKGVGGYNFTNTLATAANGEGAQSLGTSPTGTAATILELGLTNNTGAAVNGLTLSYDIDRFTKTVDSNSTSTTAPNYGVEEYPGYQLFYNLTPGNNSDWVNVASLNPTIDAGATGNVQVPNTVGITVVSPTTIQLSGAWAAGATLDLAWFDDNGESPSPDQLLGLNNVDVTAAPEPSTTLLMAVSALVGVWSYRRWRLV